MTSTRFSSLPLNPAQLDALTGLGYANMTPVQAQSLPPILQRQDVIIQAKTGSGKNCRFCYWFATPLKSQILRGAGVGDVPYEGAGRTGGSGDPSAG